MDRYSHITVGAINVALAEGLPGKIDEVHLRFNKQAKQNGIDHRMVLTNCAEITCNYTLSGNLAVIANSKKTKPEKLDGLTVIFGTGSDGASMIIAMGILMIDYSPEVDQEERNTAMASLSKGITSEAEKTSVIIGRTKYTLSRYESPGIWFIITSR